MSTLSECIVTETNEKNVYHIFVSQTFKIIADLCCSHFSICLSNLNDETPIFHNNLRPQRYANQLVEARFKGN